MEVKQSARRDSHLVDQRLDANMNNIAIKDSTICSPIISPIASVDISISFTFSDRILVVCEFIYVMNLKSRLEMNKHESR